MENFETFITILYTLWSFALFYDYLVQFVVIWYILPFLVYRIKDNLATLLNEHN
jgi:hypothetical protein